MKKIKKADVVIVTVLLMMIAGIVFMVSRGGNKSSDKGGKADSAPVPVSSVSKPLTVADYAGKKIGVQTGTVFDEMVKENIPNADISYFNSYTDLLTALKAGNIDGFAADEPMVKYMMIEDSSVDYLKDYMDDYSFGFAFAKSEEGERVCGEFSEFIKKIKTDGTLAEIDRIWFGTDESKKVIPDTGSLSGEKGRLSLATEAANPPFVYMKDNKIVGYEIDIACRFCNEYGYALDIVDMNFDGIIPAVEGGKNDFGAATMTITEERSQSVSFSEPHYDGGSVLAVRAADIGGSSDAAANGEPSYTEYIGKRIGIKTGSSFEPITLEMFPNSEYMYFDSLSDLLAALQNDKIDAFIEDEPSLRMAQNELPDIGRLKKPLQVDKYRFGFQKGTDKSLKLQREFNALLDELRSQGELDKMEAKWLGKDESAKEIDDSGLTGENGELIVAVNPDKSPFSYVKGDKLVGYSVELITLFARKYGYSLKYEYGNLAACITGLSVGKYDVFAGCLSVTEEREKSMDFSESIYDGGIVLAVRAADIVGPSAPMQQSEPLYTDYNGKRIGIWSGSYFEQMSFELFPNSEYLYFDTVSDLTVALQNNKIDGFLNDEPIARMISSEQPDISYLKKNIMDDDYSFAFGKSGERAEKLLSEFNEVLTRLRSDGELEKMKDKWLGDDESAKTYDDSGLTGKNGEIVVSAEPENVPFSYIKDGKLTGYAVELVTLFARDKGYSIRFVQGNIAACIAGLTTGAYDIFASSLSVTEERLESMNFSDTIYNGGVVLSVRASDLSAASADAHSASDNEKAAENTDSEETWIDSIKESFDKNFVREDRYKLILEGVGTTCIITALSTLIGSLLAFLICMFRRMDSYLADKIANFYVKLMQGTPMVVLLMILYYVVFGKSGLAALWVAVIGFSLNFGAYVSEILRSGIESIDPGQREAALALGYTENQAFFRFIFPQAALRQIPVYRGEIISLLKNTSIVGYIAIQDLTKMSDIIRSRTYEAFFPLIVTAVIYFILAFVISIILNLVLKAVDPRAKKSNKKGGAA